MDASSLFSLCANASDGSNTTSELWLVEDKTSAKVAASFLLLILVVGLPWNLLVVGIILKKKLYTQPTIILLLNLVLTDIFTLILRAPFQVWVGFNGEYNFGDNDFIRCQGCQLGVITVTFPLIALYTISYMSFDRFMFIYKPLKYDRIITSFRTLLILVLTWIFSLFLSILPLIGYGDVLFDRYFFECVFDHSLEHNHYIIVLSVAAVIPMVPILVCNIWLSCIVQKNIKAIYSVKKSSASNQDEVKFYNVMKKQRHQKQLHLVWVFGALMCCNLVTWIPLLIYNVLIIMGVNTQGYPNFPTATIVLFALQSLLHPIVETALIKEVWEPYKMIMLYCYVKIKSKFFFNITSSSPEPRHGCCGYCGDDTQSPGRSGCGLLDICNAAVLMNSPHPSKSEVDHS